MKQKHVIFGFIGASGSGKSTLMIELLSFFPHLEIIKSTSTRTRRDETDNLFYKFVGREYVELAENRDDFASHEFFADNHYIYEKSVIDQVLASRCGMFAILEQTVPKLQALGYKIKLIKVVPDRDWELDRSREREKADIEREQANNLTFDLTIKNSFSPGGLKKSVEEIAKFIHTTIADHAR